MKRIVGLCLAAAAIVVVFGRATCQRAPSVPAAVERIHFTDEVYFHNVGITWDGSRYYTINGGNEDYGKLNIYDKKGNFEDSYTVDLDGRSIFYDPDEEMLYVKAYGSGLATVDPEDGESDTDLEDVFSEENSSIGFAPDRSYYYEFDDGEVMVYDGLFGEEENTVDIDEYYEEEPYNSAMAASANYFFIWGGKREVLIYTLDGEYVTSVRLSVAGHPMSLSWANDMLWVAEDADGIEYDDEGNVVGGELKTGTWHGYQLRGME